MENGFLLIEREELKAYRNILRSHGYGEDAFDVSERSDPLPCAWIMALCGEVVIKCMKTGITRYYRGGEGSTWVSEFAEDLKSGVFEKF